MQYFLFCCIDSRQERNKWSFAVEVGLTLTEKVLEDFERVEISWILNETVETANNNKVGILDKFLTLISLFYFTVRSSASTEPAERRVGLRGRSTT